MRKNNRQYIKVKKHIKNLYRTPIPQDSRLNYLRLDKNESPATYDKATFRKMLRQITPEVIAAYPEPHILYNKLAKWLDVGVENVIVCNGSDGAIKSIFEAFVNENDEVLILDPTYAMFEVYIKMFGAKRIGIKFDKDFSLSKEHLLDSINKKTALVAIANPNSPTGSIIDEKFLLEIARKSRRNKAIFLADEAYYHFYPKTMAGFIKRFNNLVVTRTFSKAIGMASARLGYAIGSKEIIKEMFKVRPMYEVSGFAVKLGEFIIDNDYLIKQYVKKEKEGRKFLIEELKKMGFEVFPGFANFVLVKIGSEGSRIADFLKSRGILIAANFSSYLLRDFIRFTTGPKDKMQVLINGLKEYLNKKKRRLT